MLKDAEILIIIANSWLEYKMLVQVVISTLLEKILEIIISSLWNLYRFENSGFKTCLSTKCVSFVFTFFPFYAMVSEKDNKSQGG